MDSDFGHRTLDIGHGHGRSPPSRPVNWALIGALRATLARLINKSLKSGSDLSSNMADTAPKDPADPTVPTSCRE